MISKELKFVKLWANGEILTGTAPADRHKLKKLIEDYEETKDLLEYAIGKIKRLENKLKQRKA